MPPKEACSATASATQPAAVSAAPPAATNFLPLAQLNKASVKVGGEWAVLSFRPIEDNYQYTYQGKARQGTNFMVTLVSTDDARQYCQAQFKKTGQNEKKYDEALKKIRLGHASRCQKLLSSRMPKLRT